MTKLRNDETIKVPQMAKSITDDTLKTRQKMVGEAVAVDKGIATILTDKISLSINALARTGSLCYL